MLGLVDYASDEDSSGSDRKLKQHKTVPSPGAASAASSALASLATPTQLPDALPDAASLFSMNVDSRFCYSACICNRKKGGLQLN